MDDLDFADDRNGPLQLPDCDLCSVYQAGTEYGDRSLLALPFRRFLHGLTCYRPEADHDLFVRRWAVQRGLNPGRALRVADRWQRRKMIHAHEALVASRRRLFDYERGRAEQIRCSKMETRFLLDAWRRLGWTLP